MAVITREEIIPSPVENVTVVKAFVNGVHRQYELTANDGYVLHDKRLDYYDLDEVGNQTLVLGFAEGTKSVAASYDFATNPNEFYAVLRSEVPENQIFGGGVNNDHEVM